MYIYNSFYPPFLGRDCGGSRRVCLKRQNKQRDKGEKLYFRALYSLYLNVMELQLLYVHIFKWISNIYTREVLDLASYLPTHIYTPLEKIG